MTVRSRSRRLSHEAILAGILIAAGALSACSPSDDASPAASAAPPTTQATPENGGTASPAEGETAPPDGSPTPTTEPDLTADWSAYTSTDLELTFLIPEGWQAATSELQVLDLREADGEGWMQVRAVDAGSADEIGLDYEPGLDAAQVLDALLAGLREDGDFSAPTDIHTDTGQTALVVEGRYYVLDERLLVGVLAEDDRAIVFTGHGPEGQDAPDTEWARLSAIYKAVIRSTAHAGG